MRSKILVFALILVGTFYLPANAHLGETEEQLEARFGKPTQTSTFNDSPTEIFKKDNVCIMVAFVNGVAGDMLYAKYDGSEISDKEKGYTMNTLEGDGLLWTFAGTAGDAMAWTRSDGSTCTYLLKEHSLSFQSREFIELTQSKADDKKSGGSLLDGDSSQSANSTSARVAFPRQIFHATFRITQIIGPSEGLAIQTLDPKFSTEPGQPYLLRGIPANAAEGDSWTGSVCRSANFSFYDAQNTPHIIKCFVVQDSTPGNGSIPELNTIPFQSPTAAETVRPIWAIDAHGRDEEYTLPSSLIDALNSIHGTTGHITVEMIEKVQQGDDTAIDPIAKNVSSQDRLILLQAIRAAKKV